MTDIQQKDAVLLEYSFFSFVLMTTFSGIFSLSDPSYKIAKLLPEQSVHLDCCKQFADAVERKTLNYKLLSDSVLLIENDQFCIGRGSNGTTIYIGYHSTLESWVAVKCCYKANTADDEIKFIQNHDFRNKHSNIGSYLDCIEEDSRIYIIMELYEVNLHQFFSKNTKVTCP